MKKRLRMEELEERIAPTVIPVGGSLSWTDSNGDGITVTYYEGPDGSQVDVLDVAAGDIGAGDDIGTITFTGADFSSELVITSNGAGADDIVIDDGILAPGAQDVGLISIGLDAVVGPAGDASLGSGFAIDIGGELGTVVINSDFDCDLLGQTISAGGDIGTIAILGDLHLDGGTGLADFDAGTAGDGNISFISIDGDTHLGTGGIVVGGATLLGGGTGTIEDDAGDGTTGTLTLKLSGPAAAAKYLRIAVTGGGFVLSWVDITSPNTTLLVNAAGTGGDVAFVEFATDAAGVTISGVADTDVFGIEVDGSIGTISNKTIGGDIGFVDVASGGSLGLLQTGRMGNLGSVFTGPQNALPVFMHSDYLEADGSVVDGAIGRIQVGAITGTTIEAGSFGIINVNPGRIINSTIMTPGNIDQLNVAGLFQTDILAEGVIGKVSIGSLDMSRAMVWGLGGIGPVTAKGVISDAMISARDVDGGNNQIGAGITSISAAALINVNIEALGDIGKVNIKGAVWDSDIDAKWWDTPSATYMGGAVVNFAAGGMYDSDVDSLGNIATVRVGKGGMLYDSMVETSGNVTSFKVQGDVDDSDIYVDGTIGTLNIKGAFSNGADMEVGTVNNMTIGGAVFDSYIDVYTHAGRVNLGGLYGGDTEVYIAGSDNVMIKGGVLGDGDTILELDTYGSLTVKGNAYYAGFDLEDGAKVSFGGEAVYVDVYGTNMGSFSARNFLDSDLDLSGNLGSMKVSGGLFYADVTVNGAAGLVSISGDVMDSDIELYGATAVGVSIRGDVIATDIDVGVNGGTATVTDYVTVGGSFIDSCLDVYGPLGKVTIKGDMIYSDVYGDGAIGSIAINKSVLDCDIQTDSSIGPVAVRGHFYDSDLEGGTGLGDVTIRGNLIGSDIETGAYDGVGYPILANMGNVSAASIYDTDIEAMGNIGMITSKGLIGDTYISSVAYDNWGGGSAVGGRAIAGIKATGLMDSYIESWGDLGKITLGNHGVDGGTDITVVDANSDFLGLTTRGLISGDIRLAGDLTGSILTGGTDAPLYGETYLFTDPNGTFTDGSLVVDGAVAAGVVIS